jgi:hypothetical protein
MTNKFVDNCDAAREYAAEVLKSEYMFSVGEMDECGERLDEFIFPIYYTPFKMLKIKTRLTISIGKEEGIFALPSSKAFQDIKNKYLIPSLLTSSYFNGESGKIASPIDVHFKLPGAIESIIEHRLGPPLIYEVEQMKRINNAVKVVRNFLDAVFSNDDLSFRIVVYDRRMLSMLVRAYRNHKKLRKVESNHIDFCIGIYYSMLKRLYPINEFADRGVSVPNELYSASEPLEVPISEIKFLEPDIEFFISGRVMNSSEKVFAQIFGIACYLYLIE